MSFLGSIFTKKQTETSHTRATLNELFKTMRESVIVVGEDTRVFASNAAAYNAFGRKNGALENKRLSEVIRDLSLHEAFRQALEEEKTSDVELALVGTDKKYDVRVAPFQFDEKRGAIGIFYDISEIERLQNIRQEFLSNISHELRTPLTSILAFVETLEDGAIDDEENNLRFLGVIRRNAERMRHLLNDILELSAIESGKIEIEPKNINLTRVIEEVFTNLSAKGDEKNVKLLCKVPENTSVFADAMRLEQMLTNLIDNAVKFNREGGSVTVEYSSNETTDIISVIDTGEGISGEHLKRLFERFYRADRARSREIGGTGLGLAIVKHLARLHGGEISVSSTPGKGSTFSIELPKKSA